MKRFLIILSFLFLVNCVGPKPLTIHDKNYSFDQREEMKNDVYWYLDAYNSDSIPFYDWITYQKYIDNGYRIERVHHKRWNDSTEIRFTLKSSMADSTIYNFKVELISSEKHLK
jgi:hypothetical protein